MASTIPVLTDADIPYFEQYVDSDIPQTTPLQNVQFKRYIETKKRKQHIQNVKAENETHISTQKDREKENQKKWLQSIETKLPETPIENKQIIKSTYVHIDSTDRVKTIYKNAGNAKFFLGKNFYGVSGVQLLSLEMPNVSESVNRTNNKIYWRNLEDIDIGFPIYEATIPTGSYNLVTLNQKLNDILHSVNLKRRDGSGQPHYFIVNVNTDSMYVEFISIIAQQAPPNPIQVVAGTGFITVTQPNHGYITGETIHLIGVRGLVGGISSLELNKAFEITVLNQDSFRFEIPDTALESAIGGGNLVKTGRESPFQFMWGDGANSIAKTLGFYGENSSSIIPVIDPLTTITRDIQGILPTEFTQVVCQNHGLKIGDWVYIYNVQTFPSLYENDEHKGAFQVHNIPTPDIFEIDFKTITVYSIEQAYIGTRLIRMEFPDHGFNRITDISGILNLASVTTLLPHNLTTGDNVCIANSNTNPSIDGYYTIQVQDIDTFTIPLNTPLMSSGTNGILTPNHIFTLYGVDAVGGFKENELNNIKFNIREIIDKDAFIFTTQHGFSNRIARGGGEDIRINSTLHGWSGNHNNTVNGVVVTPINLAGDNYCFLCCPELGHMTGTSLLKDIFAKVQLEDVPGTILFNTFVSTPLHFDPPMIHLNEINFIFRSPNGDILDFKDMDYSLTLMISELVPVVKTANIITG